MNRSGDQALDQALAFHRAPGHLAAIRRLPLPKDLQTLLRIAAGDSETTLDAAQRTGESPEALREVTIFYLQQLLFADDGDSYRVLGVNPDASDEQIKLHYRSLVRWLHPDRNTDTWESVFADRVNTAWQDLRTPPRRHAYDSNRNSDDAPVSDRSHDAPAFVQSIVQIPIPGGGVKRWWPPIVVSGIGVFVVVALGLAFKLPTGHQEASGSSNPELAEKVQTQSAFPRLTADNEPTITSTPPSQPATTAPAPAPAPTPTPAPVSVPIAIAPEPAVATITSAESRPVLPAPAKTNPLVQATKPPQIVPTPATPKESVVAAPAPKPAPVAVDSRAIFATAKVSVVTSTPTPSRTSTPSIKPNPTVRDATIQSQATSSAVVSNNVTADVRPTNREVSFQTKPDAPVLIDERIAASLVSRFSQAYANGDTEQLMQLFSRDAQNGRGDRRAIAEDYRRLFETSERRRIALRDMSWLTIGDGAAIIASFETEVVPRGKTHGEHATGDIRFDLRKEEGELRIYRLSHDNRRS